MKSRIGDNARDLSQEYDAIVLNQTKFDKVKDAAQAFGFFGEKISNGIIEKIAWNAAYRSEIGKGISEVEAVKLAETQRTTARERIDEAETRIEKLKGELSDETFAESKVSL